MSIFQTPERAGALNGVPGRFYAISAHSAESETFINQTWRSERRPAPAEYGERAYIVAEVRFDDSCRNGHNSFSITGHIQNPGARDWIAGGCIHEEISKAFPELAPLIRWHLTSSDGPMHYVANTVYHAGDRDHNGLAKGETRQRMAKGGVPMWELVAIDVDGRAIKTAHADAQGIDGRAAAIALYGLETLYSGDAPPPVPALQWRPLMQVGEGRERDLDAARSTAVWPDATDAELMAPPTKLRAVLEARLPRLLEQFRTDIEAAGLQWSPATYQAPRAGLEG